MRLDKDKDNFLTLHELRGKMQRKEKEVNYIKKSYGRSFLLK